MAVRMTKEMVAELQTAFHLSDYNDNGSIFSSDIGRVVRSVKGLKPSQTEVQEMVNQVENNGGAIDMQGLVTLISQRVTHPDPERPEDLVEMFRMYDKDGRGYISVKDLRHLLTAIGEKLTDDEADNMLKASGCIERDMVNYHKFVKIVLDT